MIVYHQNNVAAFKGGHVWYWPTQPLVIQHQRISVTSALAGLIKVINETVDIMEDEPAQVVAFFQYVNETVAITENIVDVLAAGAASLVEVVNETVEIVEGSLIAKGFVQVVNETVEITEGAVVWVLGVLCYPGARVRELAGTIVRTCLRFNRYD